MINIFTLSYSRANEYFINTKPIKNANYYLIDNNKQKYTNTFACLTYTTERNIGCAGGWNLICKIAFEHLNLDKIVISQDDVTISPELIVQAYEECGDNEILGVIQPFFEFSTFVITRSVWNTVGAFDENFIYVYCEDADYKHRCYLNNIQINSLYADSLNSNKSASIKDDPSVERIANNKKYLTLKWGNSIHPSGRAQVDGQAPFEKRSPFWGLEDAAPINFIPKTRELVELYNLTDKFPSEIEYERFLKNGFISL
jgi:hypothetical protein